jgi:hypothetical protein
MTLIQRLFGREKRLVEPMRGGVAPHNANNDKAAEAASRQHMEAEVASDRERRGANDARPADTPR